MCKQRVALDMINGQARKGGLSKAALLLHEEQCKDFEQMQQEINEIKKDVASVKEAQTEMNRKIDNLIGLVESKSSFKANLKEIINNRIFIYILITLMCGAFGASVGGVGTFLFK